MTVKQTGRVSNPSCTVAVISSGERESLQTCIDAVARQLTERDELLLVYTTDKPALSINTSACKLRQLSFVRETFDFAAARNYAVQQAGGDIIAFTDDDCIPAMDWLQRIQNAYLAATPQVVHACLLDRMRIRDGGRRNLPGPLGCRLRGFLSGDEAHYPATSNFAAWREVLLQCPFQESGRSNTDDLYLAGREDAEWWRTARISGLNVRTVPEATVFHDIPATRLRYSYVASRMHADGKALWSRRGSPGLAEHAISELVDSFCQLLHSLGSLDIRKVVRACLWYQRQRAVVAAARFDAREDCRSAASPRNLRRMHYAALRQHTSDLYCRFTGFTTQLPPSPATIFVSALTYLGDTVLLRPVIQLLAQSLPNTHFYVAARYPDLLQELPHNVEVNAVAQQTRMTQAEVALVPYYAHGSQEIWRNQLASRSVTFDQEVGFKGRRDTRIAHTLIPKDFNTHELHNLLHLFAQWPLAGSLEFALPSATAEAAEELQQAVPFFAPAEFITIQTDSGWPGKDWPLEQWLELARRITQASNLAIVFITASPKRDALIAHLANLEYPYAAVDETLSISALALLLKKARLAIGPDSGPKHLAMAQGTPTFTLYGPTEPQRWGALVNRKQHHYVSGTSARLTHDETIGLAPDAIIRLIDVDTVHDAVAKHLQSLASPN